MDEEKGAATAAPSPTWLMVPRSTSSMRLDNEIENDGALVETFEVEVVDDHLVEEVEASVVTAETESLANRAAADSNARLLRSISSVAGVHQAFKQFISTPKSSSPNNCSAERGTVMGPLSCVVVEVAD